MFTLPTETQWEYAARGGKKSKGYNYSGSNDIGEVAWYYENSGEGLDEASFDILANPCKTHPVGKMKANELGLFDMSGNVWEWCLDDYPEMSDKTTAEFSRSNDKGGPACALRGGSWINVAGYCRSAFRNGNASPNSRTNTVGFRVALVPERY